MATPLEPRTTIELAQERLKQEERSAEKLSRGIAYLQAHPDLEEAVNIINRKNGGY